MFSRARITGILPEVPHQFIKLSSRSLIQSSHRASTLEPPNSILRPLIGANWWPSSMATACDGLFMARRGEKRWPGELNPRGRDNKRTTKEGDDREGDYRAQVTHFEFSTSEAGSEQSNG